MTQPVTHPVGRRQEVQQHSILRALYEEFRVVSAKADRAREAERLAKQRFEDALLTAPKPGEIDQAWIDAYVASLHADVWTSHRIDDWCGSNRWSKPKVLEVLLAQRKETALLHLHVPCA